MCSKTHFVRTRSRTMELQQLKGNRVNVQKQECRLKKNLGNEAVRTTGRLPLQHPSPKTMRKATERLPYTRTTQDVSPAASTPSHSLSLLFVGAIAFFLEFYQSGHHQPGGRGADKGRARQSPFNYLRQAGCSIALPSSQGEHRVYCQVIEVLCSRIGLLGAPPVQLSCSNVLLTRHLMWLGKGRSALLVVFASM